MWDDVRECPSTWALAASWVLVYSLMYLVPESRPTTAPSGDSLISVGAISTTTSHRFGDMTWVEVRHGEVWRTLTATFVHFTLLHLVMNLIGLIKLGRLIEPWYGPGPFLAVCLAIGGFGNLVGGLLRLGVGGLKARVATSVIARTWPALADRLTGGPMGLAPMNIHTGGGSTILLGLLGLAAVVGWRSRTRIGGFLRDQMVALLVFTAVLGVVMVNLVDNYGHAGGALVGAAIGFAHRPLIRVSNRKAVQKASWATVGLIALACLVAAIRDDRSDLTFNRELAATSNRVRSELATLQDLERLYILYGRRIVRASANLSTIGRLDYEAKVDLFSRGPLVMPQAQDPAQELEQVARDRLELEEVLDRLDHASIDLPDLARLRELGRLAIVRVPRFDQAYEYVVCSNQVVKALQADLARSQLRLVELGQIRNGAH